MNERYVIIKSEDYLRSHDFPHGINPEMYKYCGKALRIKKNYRTYFFLEGNEWTWDEDMVIEKTIYTIKNE